MVPCEYDYDKVKEQLEAKRKELYREYERPLGLCNEAKIDKLHQELRKILNSVKRPREEQIKKVPFWRLYCTKYDSRVKAYPEAERMCTEYNYTYKEIVQLCNETDEHRSFVAYPRKYKDKNHV